MPHWNANFFHMCVDTVAFRRPGHLGVLRSFGLRLSRLPLLQTSLSPQRRDWWRHLFRTVSHLSLSGHWLGVSIFVLTCRKRKCLEWLSKALIYEYSCMALGVIVLLSSFSRKSSIPFDPRPLGYLVLGLSHECRFYLMELDYILADYLARFVPLLAQCILPSGHSHRLKGL